MAGSAQVTVNNVAVALTTADDVVPYPDRKPSTPLLVANTSATDPVFLGGSAVTAATGYEVAAGASVTLDISPREELYAISNLATAGPVVHVLQVGIE